MCCGLKKFFNQIWNIKAIILICYAIFAMTMAVEVGFRTKENVKLTASATGSRRTALNMDLVSGGRLLSTIGKNWERRLMTINNDQINDFQRRYLNEDEGEGGEGEGENQEGEQGEACEVTGKGTITYVCVSETNEESFLIPIIIGSMIGLPGVLLFIYVIFFSGAWGAKFGTFEYVLALVEVRKRKCFKFFVWFGCLGILGFTGFMIYTENEDGQANQLVIQILIQNTITILLAWGEMYTPNADVLQLKKIKDSEVLGLKFNFSIFSTAANCMEYIEDGLLAVLISDNYLPLRAVGVTKPQAKQMIQAIAHVNGTKRSAVQKGPGEGWDASE